MTTLRTAAQQALEAMNAPRDAQWQSKHTAAIIALRAALAEPVQEPVALGWLHKWANHDDGEPETQWHEGYEAARRVVQIHLTAPPQRKPLSEKEVFKLLDYGTQYTRVPEYAMNFVRAIERAHGIGGQDESA